MTPLCNDLEAKLLRALRTAGRTVSAQELGAALEVDARKARALCSHLRADHCAPICSTPSNGYWWPRTPAEVERAVAQLLSRIPEIEKAAAGLRVGGEWLFGDERTGQMGLGL